MIARRFVNLTHTSLRSVRRSGAFVPRPALRTPFSSTSLSYNSEPQQPPVGKARETPTLGAHSALRNPTKISQPAFTKAGMLLKVDITETAAKKLAEVRELDKRPDMVLRIHVESGGCHGFQYVFSLPDASDIKDTDSIFERDGSRVVIDHRSLRILRDSSVDYTTELIGSQFKVQSPHTSSSCGCGSSFSLDMED